ncbi:MAG: patatin-like phospholipase family protein [Anaerolineae bacterium]|nr:patatin-like phospholipase family protein [Anaerolineae bacterium]
MQYDLVFEGGGAKGMVFVGALQEFEAQGHTHGRLLGTSAGAITAALLAAGYDSSEMLEALDEKQDGRPVFANFMGVPAEFDPKTLQHSVLMDFLHSIDLPLVPDFIEDMLDQKLVEFLAKRPRYRHVLSLLEFGGWFSADSFVSWLKNKLDSGTREGKRRNFGGMNLTQFYEATSVELSLIASDTTGKRMLILNHQTAADCPLVWAVRMSMNIPLLWQEVIWQAEWGTYRGIEMANHVIVDGGMLSNFPIELFISKLDDIVKVMGPNTSDGVLGFLIDETLPVAGVEAQAGEEKKFDPGELRTIQRIAALLDTMMQAHDKMVIEAFDNAVVRLPAKGYGTTEFDMTDERKESLVNAGQQAMQTYLADTSMISAVSFGTDESSQAAALDGETVRIADRIATRILG